MSSSSKKRKTDSDTLPAAPATVRQTIPAFIVQSIQRYDHYADREYTTHGVFSTLTSANEAARRFFNKLGEEYGGDLAPITKAHITKAYAGMLARAKARTGRRFWRIGSDWGDDDGDGKDDNGEDVPSAARTIAWQKHGALSLELDHEGNGEELKVWVVVFGMDGDMPEEEKRKVKALPREDVLESSRGWNYPIANYYY